MLVQATCLETQLGPALVLKLAGGAGVRAGACPALSWSQKEESLHFSAGAEGFAQVLGKNLGLEGVVRVPRLGCAGGGDWGRQEKRRWWCGRVWSQLCGEVGGGDGQWGVVDQGLPWSSQRQSLGPAFDNKTST